MKIFSIILILAILAVSYSTYLYTKQSLGYHIHYISQKNSIAGNLSELWLQTCPEVSDEAVEPNSIFGVVVAGREMLNEKFEPVMNTLIECGHDINKRDSIGLTPLHAAILYSDLIAVKSVLSFGANKELLLFGAVANKYGKLGFIEYAKILKTTDPEIIGYLVKLP